MQRSSVVTMVECVTRKEQCVNGDVVVDDEDDVRATIGRVCFAGTGNTMDERLDAIRKDLEEIRAMDLQLLRQFLQLQCSLRSLVAQRTGRGGAVYRRSYSASHNSFGSPISHWRGTWHLPLFSDHSDAMKRVLQQESAGTTDDIPDYSDLDDNDSLSWSFNSLPPDIMADRSTWSSQKIDNPKTSCSSIQEEDVAQLVEAYDSGIEPSVDRGGNVDSPKRVRESTGSVAHLPVPGGDVTGPGGDVMGLGLDAIGSAPYMVPHESDVQVQGNGESVVSSWNRRSDRSSACSTEERYYLQQLVMSKNRPVVDDVFQKQPRLELESVPILQQQQNEANTDIGCVDKVDPVAFTTSIPSASSPPRTASNNRMSLKTKSKSSDHIHILGREKLQLGLTVPPSAETFNETSAKDLLKYDVNQNQTTQDDHEARAPALPPPHRVRLRHNSCPGVTVLKGKTGLEQYEVPYEEILLQSSKLWHQIESERQQGIVDKKKITAFQCFL